MSRHLAANDCRRQHIWRGNFVLVWLVSGVQHAAGTAVRLVCIDDHVGAASTDGTVAIGFKAGFKGAFDILVRLIVSIASVTDRSVTKMPMGFEDAVDIDQMDY